MEIYSFKDKTPKRGKIVCFSEEDAQANFYFLDGRGDAWSRTDETCGWEHACRAEDLSSYRWGHYSHWARTDKVFNMEYDIPKDD